MENHSVGGQRFSLGYTFLNEIHCFCLVFLILYVIMPWVLLKGIKTLVLTVTAKEANILCDLLGRTWLWEENGNFHSIALEISKDSN